MGGGTENIEAQQANERSLRSRGWGEGKLDTRRAGEQDGGGLSATRNKDDGVQLNPVPHGDHFLALDEIKAPGGRLKFIRSFTREIRVFRGRGDRWIFGRPATEVPMRTRAPSNDLAQLWRLGVLVEIIFVMDRQHLTAGNSTSILLAISGREQAPMCGSKTEAGLFQEIPVVETTEIFCNEKAFGARLLSRFSVHP